MKNKNNKSEQVEIEYVPYVDSKNGSSKKIIVKKKRRKILVGRVIFALFLLGLLVFSIFKLLTNDSLYDKWESTESSTIVKFYKNGKVKIEGEDISANFLLLNEDKMEYTVEGKKFNMYYKVDDDLLYWGVNLDNLEKFTRK